MNEPFNGFKKVVIKSDGVLVKKLLKDIPLPPPTILGERIVFKKEKSSFKSKEVMKCPYCSKEFIVSSGMLFDKDLKLKRYSLLLNFEKVEK